jgi:hypothetical protein
MPIRPREINDQITDARLQEIVRHLVNIEVRRLVTTSSGLQAQIDANEENIEENAEDIGNLSRRIDGEQQGIYTYPEAAQGGAQETEQVFSLAQVWSVTLDKEPVLTLWEAASFSYEAAFDTFVFDAKQFDEITATLTLAPGATVTYAPATNTLSIDWGVAKSGSVFVINHGTGIHYSVVAVAD